MVFSTHIIGLTELPHTRVTVGGWLPVGSRRRGLYICVLLCCCYAGKRNYNGERFHLLSNLLTYFI